MSAQDLLRDLRARGITVKAFHGTLQLNPQHLLTDADRDDIRQHKPELLKLLAEAPAPEPFDAYALLGRPRPEMSLDDTLRRVLREMDDADR